MKPFSFVHVADLHLGYTQYNLDARREDFNKAFIEFVEKTLDLKPDFMIIAGDIFQHPRPSNMTLENAITNFRRLKDAGIPCSLWTAPMMPPQMSPQAQSSTP